MSEIIPINMDRISSLPDSLQCHILSFLPIKESVATSILSRSWRHRWKDLQVFAFKEEFFRRHDLSSTEVYMRFVAFVDAVLEQRRFPHIKKFSLVCKTIDQDIFTRWISEAVESRLQELCIAVQDGSSAMEISLPDSLFTCTSLVSLSLDNLSRYLYHIPFVHLPSLKNLELYIHFADIDLADIDNLFLGCPVLEKLELRFFLLCISTIHIPPTLKSLTIAEEYHSVRDDDMIECIEIVTPSLEYLYIEIHRKCLKIVVCNFANMVEAHLDISLNDSHADWVPQLLKAVSSAKFLVLRESTTKCLLCAPVLDLPDFRHLVKLQIYFSPFNSNFMMNMLKKCHVLQVLTIRDVKASHRRILPVPTIPFCRQASHRRILPVPTDVPNCLVSHLTTVNFSFYHFCEVELEFIAYILHNGLVLEEVRIRFYPRDYSMVKHRIREELSLVPRGSWTCRVHL